MRGLLVLFGFLSLFYLWYWMSLGRFWFHVNIYCKICLDSSNAGGKGWTQSLQGFPYWGVYPTAPLPPHQSRICSFSPPPGKISPVDSPHQIFIHPVPEVNFPPLNNNFHVNPIKTSFLAVVISPVPFLF